ncbi:MAG TPA: YciI family protein [Pseudonocardiaceae bacterium]|nr:YciI family protein [Pseudonocardiaceae bacterium]
MVLIYGNEAAWEALHGDRLPETMRVHDAVIEELTRSGELVANAGLTTVDARTIRLRDGVPAVTDGPFAEVKEYVAGFYLLECESADRAAEIALRLPEAGLAPIEVRRVMDGAELRGT